ncbi:putative membrane protein YdjX (TVP38/TMEM64 family) [Salirhabdus euzebyi]|uniref:TVP38/TMEM64 family membrane protein n=1 Tax=Salirhabdus euzebyi TaxID=394506 RepID=A0A841Q2X1_9BACI|nr:VTT domain-containing protein [Salirhabdus euzebyi]MBB6451788.1 putative membrane protein YdjX (TVP38/TMEM64 family) [Salirhabdus euzebyi]
MDFIVGLLTESGPLAYLVSICANIIVSVFAIIPSFFITAANITVFGFTEGMLLSLIGESIGALISFILYRKGINLLKTKYSIKNRLLLRLESKRGFDAFVLIFLLRLVPFVPSGLVNVAASLSSIKTWLFFWASSLGKIPALLLEAYSVNHVLQSSVEEKAILLLLTLLVGTFYYFFRKRT